MLSNLSRCTLTLQNEGFVQPKQPPNDSRVDDSSCSSTPKPEVVHTSTATGDLIGLDLWPASVALCRYLAAHPQIVLKEAVVELGAGESCGLRMV